MTYVAPVDTPHSRSEDTAENEDFGRKSCREHRLVLLSLVEPELKHPRWNESSHQSQVTLEMAGSHSLPVGCS